MLKTALVVQATISLYQMLFSEKVSGALLVK